MSSYTEEKAKREQQALENVAAIRASLGDAMRAAGMRVEERSYQILEGSKGQPYYRVSLEGFETTLDVKVVGERSGSSWNSEFNGKARVTYTGAGYDRVSLPAAKDLSKTAVRILSDLKAKDAYDRRQREQSRRSDDAFAASQRVRDAANLSGLGLSSKVHVGSTPYGVEVKVGPLTEEQALRLAEFARTLFS